MDRVEVAGVLGIEDGGYGHPLLAPRSDLGLDGVEVQGFVYLVTTHIEELKDVGPVGQDVLERVDGAAVVRDEIGTPCLGKSFPLGRATTAAVSRVLVMRTYVRV